jgi:hypothetical protein
LRAFIKLEARTMAESQRLALALLACFTLFCGATTASAEGLEFRVDTELFRGDEKKPILEQLTIFTADGTVYDFSLTSPKETMVFDPRHGRFTLLEETRKVKAIVTTQELINYALALENEAAKEHDPLFAFCAAPHFETTDNDINHNGQPMTELRLTSKPLTYTAIGLKAEKPDAAKAYRHFADWCARLNSSRVGNLPSNARLVLNDKLAERGLLPFEVTRTIPPTKPLGKKLDLRSEHRVNWTLSDTDRRKIASASDMIAKFEVVSYDQYRSESVNPAPPPANQARR